MKIVPVTGSTIYLTDHVKDLVAQGGHTYLSTAGYEFTGYEGTTGFSPSSIDIGHRRSLSGVTRAAVGSRLFDGARMLCFLQAGSHQ